MRTEPSANGTGPPSARGRSADAPKVRAPRPAAVNSSRRVMPLHSFFGDPRMRSVSRSPLRAVVSAYATAKRGAPQGVNLATGKPQILDETVRSAYRVLQLTSPIQREANVPQVNTTEPMSASWLWLLLPLGLWIVLWLWAVNWQKLWPVLAHGAWAPAFLLLLMSAVVLSRIEPWRFIWQLGIVTGLAILALFCGWLQGCFHATPAEVRIDPPAVADHGHGHAH